MRYTEHSTALADQVIAAWGLASPKPHLRGPVAERVAFYVDRTGGAAACWPWSAGRCRDGYGIVSIKNRPWRATHAVLTFLCGATVPVGMCVCHRCDNPPCCNPSHLFVGTNADNMADKARKGRGKNPTRSGELNHLSVLKEAQVYEIARRLGRGERPYLVAAAVGTSRPTIFAIRSRKTWKHLDLEPLLRPGRAPEEST